MSFLLVDVVSWTDTASKWLPYSLAPTLKSPSGKVVKLVSRDCCPYLDDYEPNYCPVVSAVTQANEDKRVKTSVTRDPAGPTFDEPKVLRKKRVRPPGRHPLSDFNSDSDIDSDDDVCALARGAWSSPLHRPHKSSDPCRR